ncbi:MAG: hypothetical protein HYZ48_05120, partial [Chlamydiales bacterium]|nr:hypothetical protein [Chlamydiales bacterium]
KLPFWLNPEQVRILLLAEESRGYAQKIKKELESQGIALFIDEEGLPLKERLHKAFIQKIPFVALIGKKEMESCSVSYRTLDSPENQKMGSEDFINMIIDLNRSKDSEFEN